MVRFKLSNPQCWSSWAAGEKLCIWVELDEETNKELTTQMCEGILRMIFAPAMFSWCTM